MQHVHLCDRHLQAETAWEGRNASSKLWDISFTSAAGAQKQQRMEEHSKRTPFPSTNCRLPPPPQLEGLHESYVSAEAAQKIQNRTEGLTGGEEGWDKMLTQTRGQPRISPRASE